MQFLYDEFCEENEQEVGMSIYPQIGGWWYVLQLKSVLVKWKEREILTFIINFYR